VVSQTSGAHPRDDFQIDRIERIDAGDLGVSKAWFGHSGFETVVSRHDGEELFQLPSAGCRFRQAERDAVRGPATDFVTSACGGAPLARGEARVSRLCSRVPGAGAPCRAAGAFAGQRVSSGRKGRHQVPVPPAWTFSRRLAPPARLAHGFRFGLGLLQTSGRPSRPRRGAASLFGQARLLRRAANARLSAAIFVETEAWQGFA